MFNNIFSSPRFATNLPQRLCHPNCPSFFKNVFRGILLIFCLGHLGVALGGPDAKGDYEQGLAALEANDYGLALEKFHSAAETGHAEAQAALGELYLRGIGIKRNAQEAAKWYRMAAEQGHLDAQVTLGWMYDAGTGVPQDFDEAIKWLRRAAEKGHPGAQNNLAVLYRQGRGGANKVDQAVQWFQKAANQGVAPAQYALGQMYLNGEGIKQDTGKAVMWYAKAAEQGLLEAQADLGYLYAKREEKVPQDYLVAYKWLSLAMQQGDRMAPRDLEDLKADMTPEQIAEAEKLVKAWNQQHAKDKES